MKIYNYHPVTKEFLGESMAKASPLEEGVFLIPANATAVNPPSAAQGMTAVFDGSSWASVPDNRGKTFYSPTGDKVTIDEIGAVPPDGWTEDYVESLPTPEDLLAIEKNWASLEVVKVRERIEEIEDGDSRGRSSVQLWREYRKDLRNYLDVLDGNRPVEPA